MQKIITALLLFLSPVIYAQEKWEAPEEVAKIDNPLTVSTETIESGQKIFKKLCVACHGEEGGGDGIAAAGLTPKPTDFTTPLFQEQSDGAVFWKLSTGKGVMTSYEGMLSDEDRWAIVAYLKSLKTRSRKKKIVDNIVKNTFLFTQLINTQTTEVLPEKTSEFTIQHRFGATDLTENFIKDFMGADLSSNIRLAYAVAISDKIYAELGRTKYGKIYDLSMKYRFLQQTIDNKIPVSMALYANMAVGTSDFPTVVEGSTFEGGGLFSYSFFHRMSYNAQLIISRKFTDRFSMQATPIVIWRNLVKPNEENLNISVAIGGRLRITNRSAILFEVTPKIIANNKQTPLALTYEIASSSAHAFQIVLSSNDWILENNIYTNPGYDYTKGKFVLGFNIKRQF